jgi:signal transduction histidine kinase
MPNVRVVALWAVVSLPVVWAAATSRAGRLSWGEAVVYLVVLAVAVHLVRRQPVIAMVLAIEAWLTAFLSRALVDSALGVTVLAAGVVAVSLLAGRHALDGGSGSMMLVLAVGGAAVAAVVVTGGVDTALAAAAGIGVLAVVPWAIGRYRRRYAELMAAGWQRAEQLAREAERIRDQERARLAAEMHDLVGHELAQAALRVGAIEVTSTLPEQHREAARVARAGVTAAAERLADVIRLLRTDREEPIETVEQIVDSARESGLDVELDAEQLELDAVIARTVHRVLAEAVTNAIKHAPGAPVAVYFHRAADDPDLVDLRIENPPGGATTATSGGQGLRGLAERVALVGGTFTARRVDGGFAVAARLPVTPHTTVSPVAVDQAAARREVRRSARRTLLVTVGVSTAIVASVLGYLVYDAATSVLDKADFDRLRIGQPSAEVAPVLPDRTRVDAPEPVPAGTTCRYYSTHANPFDERRGDLYRLCFRDGRLADKALLVRH